jgi:hypothetical protein
MAVAAGEALEADQIQVEAAAAVSCPLEILVEMRNKEMGEHRTLQVMLMILH